MATAGQAGISDAAAGAGLGTAFGGPYGAAIGGVLGGLFGLFTGGSSTPQAPLFSDINLAQDNPELYQQLQAQQGVVNAAQAAYTNRLRGETAEQQAQYQQMMGQQNQSAGARGMLGTAQGQQAQEAAALNFNNQANQQTQNQAQQLLGQYNQAQQGLTQATQQGLQQTYNAQMVPYQQAIGQAGNNNQMYSGLMSGGLGLLGQGMNNYNNQITGPSGYLPDGFGFGAPGQGITYSGGQNPLGGGGYVAPGTAFGAMPIGNIMPQAQANNYSLGANMQMGQWQ